MLRKLTLHTLIMSLLLFLGCASTSTPAVSKSNTLKVGMSVNYPPIAYMNNGKPAGLEVDFANLLAKELKKELEIKVIPWEKLSLALTNGEIDIAMAGSSITAERQKFMLFSDSYLNISQMAAMRKNDKAPNIDNSGYQSKIGYKTATTSEIFVKNTFYNAQAEGYETVKEGILAVSKNEIDYFFHDAPSIWYYSKEFNQEIKGWYVPYTNERLAWSFSPSKLSFKNRVNRILKKWKTDGTLQTTIDKWIPVKIIQPKGEKIISFE